MLRLKPQVPSSSHTAHCRAALATNQRFMLLRCRKCKSTACSAVSYPLPAIAAQNALSHLLVKPRAKVHAGCVSCIAHVGRIPIGLLTFFSSNCCLPCLALLKAGPISISILCTATCVSHGKQWHQHAHQCLALSGRVVLARFLAFLSLHYRTCTWAYISSTA